MILLAEKLNFLLHYLARKIVDYLKYYMMDRIG